jgi:TolB protein
MFFLGILLLVSLLVSGCVGVEQAVGTPAQLVQSEPAETEPAQTEPVQMANPASQNCIDQGGTLAFEQRADLGEIGVCYFEDNRQCEEWALFYGDCPAGGVKVTGYATEAGRFCAITGGTYAATSESGADPEQGTCTFANGVVCVAWDYYNGVCDPDQEPTPVPASNTQWYVDQAVGYALEVPETWSEQTLPDQNEGTIHGMAYSGAEGGMEVYWGVGFGGACPGGTQPAQLAQGEVEACYALQDDGTEVWSQIGYQVEGGNDFSARAYTSDTQPTSHDLVLQVLATLTFRVPATTAIQPLSMEVCDGQAQAMSHTLDDLIPTQSEALLDDYVNNAWGTGCRSTITGTGVDFENPSVVVDELGAMLESQGYSADPALVADGPTGTSQGYRSSDQICWAGAGWQPDAATSCPADQPISACDVPPEHQSYSVTLDCGVETPLGESTVTPGGSPEIGGGAGQIVFDSDRGGDQIRDLYLINSDGYDVSRLTRGDANSFAGPWSPDGQRIVYTAFGLTNSTIAVINADGSGQTSLSAIEGSDEAFPDWSPDGQRIAFTSRRDGNNEIYLMEADGSNSVRLTDQPGDDFAPSWSPDGTKIVFVSDRDQTAGIYDLYIMNADGSGVTRLTNDTFIDYSPDWSPDGQQIAFRSDRDGESDIYVINVDGSGETRLTEDPAYDWSPQWSPDGRYIAFQTDRDGNFEIYRMAPDGSDPVNLTNDPGDDQMPFWRP